VTSAETAGMPVLLQLAGQRAVIIGGGDGATSLASALIAHGADVTVVAVAASVPLHRLAASGRVALLSRPYVRGDLAGAFVAACFEGGEIRDAVASEAVAERALLTVPGHPELSNVAFAGLADLSAPVEESL